MIALAGCGGASLTGQYTGPLDYATTCSGQTETQSSRSTLTIEEQGETGELNVGGGCPLIAGAISGNHLSLQQPVTCPDQERSDGSTVSITFTSGTLTLDGSKLQVSLVESLSLRRDGETGQCTGTISGTLQRQ